MKSVHSRNPNASTTKEISVSAKIYEKARLSMVTAFLELGFEQASHRYDEENLTHHYRLSPCPEGTYSLGSRGCQKCPPGNFMACTVGVLWESMHSLMEYIGRHLGLHSMWRSGAREKFATRFFLPRPNSPRFANSPPNKTTCTSARYIYALIYIGPG